MERETSVLYDGITQIHSKGKSGGITIRRPFMTALGLRPGSVVQVRLVDRALVIRPLDESIRRAEENDANRDRAAVAVARG